MKLLLCKTVENLGIVGDVVEVSAGYARNFLLPHRLATEPTQVNMRALAEARRQAELERAQRRAELEALAKRMEGVEVTIRARANEDGVLYGSVGPRDVAHALQSEGYPIKPEHVSLHRPIRHLDNVPVDLRFGEGLTSAVKVWVVREKDVDDEGEEGSAGTEPGMEAAAHDVEHD